MYKVIAKYQWTFEVGPGPLFTDNYALLAVKKWWVVYQVLLIRKRYLPAAFYGRMAFSTVTRSWHWTREGALNAHTREVLAIDYRRSKGARF